MRKNHLKQIQVFADNSSNIIWDMRFPSQDELTQKNQEFSVVFFGAGKSQLQQVDFFDANIFPRSPCFENKRSGVGA